MALDKFHYGAGVAFFVLNVLGQCIFGYGAKETVLMVIGTFIHLIAAGLLGFSLVLLMQTLLVKTQPSPSRPQGQQQSGIDVDMVIAYSLFAFTGMALTCVAVYLRAGSFYWNFFSIFLGFVLAFAADPSIRTKLKKNITLPGAEVEVDTWSAGTSPNSAPNPGIRQRL